MKILDCTLRDGGYYTNWDFDHALVLNYIDSLNHLPVDYIEIGYRSDPMKGYLGEYFYCPLYIVDEIRLKSEKKLAIILNEKDVSPEAAVGLLEPLQGKIDMIRLAVDPSNFVRATKLGAVAKSLGFELTFNVMYMSKWEQQSDLMDNLQLLDGLADCLYMVDSFGGVFPKDVIRIIGKIREKTNIPLGFHGHNNLELALINTLTALEYGVEMADATITGMGRGAGNLKMELLLSVLNSQGKVDFDYNYLSKVTDGFSKLQEVYGWGTNLPYMVSGANSLPQKQVMEWVSKRFYSFNSILRALSNQSKGITDNKKLPTIQFEEPMPYDGVLLVGGGGSVVSHSKPITEFLMNNPKMALIHSSSRNAMVFKDVPNDQYFCLVGNEGHRLEEVFGNVDLMNGKCILPPFPRKMGTYIPDSVVDKSFELLEVKFTDKLKDTHTALALQTAFDLKSKVVFVVGYDGYSGNTLDQKQQEIFLENEYLFERAGKAGLECISLTATKYQGIKQESLFSRV